MTCSEFLKDQTFVSVILYFISLHRERFFECFAIKNIFSLLQRIRELENEYMKIEKNLMECQVINTKYKAIQEQLQNVSLYIKKEKNTKFFCLFFVMNRTIP